MYLYPTVSFKVRSHPLKEKFMNSFIRSLNTVIYSNCYRYIEMYLYFIGVI